MGRRLSFRRAFLGLSVILSALFSVHATEVMRRPDNYQEPPRQLPTSPNVTTASASGKVSFAYFTNWGIYGRNFQPTDIVESTLTHILYAFADTAADSGAIRLTDSWADEQIRYPGDSWDEPGNNLYGCLKQLYLLKLQKRDLKVLLSIGGWTYSQAGHFAFVTSPSSRTNFVNNAIQLVEDYGFDGIDIDFEYPANAAQGQGFADLLTELRGALNSLASRKGDSTPYQLTAAVAAGANNYAYLVVPQMDAALDYWNLMAYDYAGSWLTYADHQANVYGGERTGVSTDAAVNWYLANGATAGKITMGIPLYGRAFEQTNGIGQPYTGIGQGSWEAGVYDYKALPFAGAQVIEDTSVVASYSYDSANRELISYDTPNIASIKTDYINNRGLAGSMFWELSSDKIGAESLVGVSAARLGALDSTQNHINFPNSRWDNVRSNMGNGGSTPAPSPTTTGGGSTPTGGGCSGVAAWSSGTVYTGGQTATYNGRLWTARWWTQGETPGTADVWTDSGACFDSGATC